MGYDETVPVKQKLDQIYAELGKARELKKAAQQKLIELQEGRKDQLGDMPQFVKERDEVGVKIREKIVERNQIRDELKAKEREYREYQYKLQQERRARQQQAQQELDEQKNWNG